METKEIPDAQINASSQLDVNNAPGQARLHLKRIGDKQGGWSAFTNDFNQWLLVDLGSLSMVTRVATQGKNGFDQWVSRYRLQYSIDGDRYSYITKSANSSAQVTIISHFTQLSFGSSRRPASPGCPQALHSFFFYKNNDCFDWRPMNDT